MKKILPLIATAALLATSCGIHGGSTFNTNGCDITWRHAQLDPNGMQVDDGEGTQAFARAQFGEDRADCVAARLCLAWHSAGSGTSDTKCSDWIPGSPPVWGAWVVTQDGAGMTALTATLEVQHYQGSQLVVDVCDPHDTDGSNTANCPPNIPT